MILVIASAMSPINLNLVIDHNLLKQDPNNSSHLRTTQYISKQKWKFNQNRHFVLFLLSTFWRIYVSPLPRCRRVHAYSARGVILEHAVRCRACFTLPATPAGHFFPPSPPRCRVDTDLFIYLDAVFLTPTCGNGWRRLLVPSVCVCTRTCACGRGAERQREAREEPKLDPGCCRRSRR